jgi:DnaK suppressor protein
MQKKATTAAAAKSAQKAARSAPAKSAPASGRAVAKVATTKKAPPAPAKAVGKATPEKATAKPAPAKKAAPAKGGATGTVTKSAATRPAKEVPKTVAAKKADAPAAKKTASAPKAKVRADRAAFLAKQRELLLEERRSYITSAEALKAQADSLALEHEPGDVQFDEEGGEGGTANVDREIDLYLSAQARATVVEIDRALQKIEDGTYGVCEQCGDTIPDARLQALPYAALCVTCKSGGLSSRR